MSDPISNYLLLCGVGVVGGLVTLARGLLGYRTGTVISGTATSHIATLAAGDVRVSGTVEPAELLLHSPLQDRECVWYRSRVSGTEGSERPFFEERGVGFRLRDASGAIRVFPAGARIDVPDQFHEQTGMLGEPPIGLNPRHETTVSASDPVDRETAIQELLTVHVPEPLAEPLAASGTISFGGPGAGMGGQRQRYSEARIEPGDVITIVGAARPFSDLEDPATSDALDGSVDPQAALNDPEIAADFAAAQASGELLTPEEAWGNAAIPGFGIDRPVRAPVLDPGAHAPTLATPAEADKMERSFDLAPDALVLASAPDAPLLIVSGTPGEAVARDQGRFLVGLAGAVVAIVSALAGAYLLTAH